MGGPVTTVVIVDEHAAVVEGVRRWCADADPPIGLVDAGGGLAGVWTGQGAAADVVLVDVELFPGWQGPAELRRLVAAGRRVIVYSQHVDPTTAARCAAVGAHACLTKREGAERLVPAIRAVAAGRRYLSPALGGTHQPARPALSPRELEVLRAWFVSPSKHLAAAKLFLSAKTVDTYIQRVRTKYANTGRAAPTKSDLMTRVLDDGFITFDELTTYRAPVSASR